MRVPRIFRTAEREFPDPYFRRLRSLVIGEGMLKESNIFLMDLAVRHMPSEGSAVEIGAYGGLSSLVILHLLKKHNRANGFFNCDAWIYEGYANPGGNSSEMIDGREDVHRRDFGNYMKQAYVNAMQLLSPSDLPHTFHLRSDDFFRYWNANTMHLDIFGREVLLGGPISFAYIDGDHSFEQTVTDFENVARSICRGGFILLDDSADNYTYGSAGMTRIIRRDKRFVIVNKDHNYLLKRV